MHQQSALVRRTGWTAVCAGALAAVSVGAELVHRVERDSTVVDRPVFAVYLVLFAAGMAALAAAYVGLRRLYLEAPAKPRRTGRVGLWLCILGAVLNLAFALVHGGVGTATGETTDAFVLFGLGMLFLLVGQVLVAVGIGRAGLLARAPLYPLAGAAGLALALFVSRDPFHDIGLFVLFGSWLAIGLALLSRDRQRSARSSAERHPARRAATSSESAVGS